MRLDLVNRLGEQLAKLRQAAYAQRQNFQRHLEMFTGHRNYTRFIILGRSRSGSNLLRGLLNTHGQVVAFGELFQTESSIEWGLSDYPQTPQLLNLFREQPVRFLQTQVFRKFPKRIQAVGFKLFYYHARTPAWSPVWDFLAGQPDIKVLHIRRGNLLRVHLSRKRAMLTDRWVNTSGAVEPLIPLALDYDECLADFVQTRRWESEAEGFWSTHPILNITFETLAQDYAPEMARVHDFLGIEHLAPAPATYRQSNHPLSVAITNYHALKERFAGSEWHTLFEE